MHKLYVLEGVDSVGKTTLSSALSKQHKWKYLSTPGTDFKKQLTYAEQSNDDNLGFLILTSAILYSSNILQKEIKTNTIICDRYYPTIYAYAKAKNFIQKYLLLKKLPIIRPNKIIHLFVEYDVIVARLKKKRNINVDEKRIITDKSFYLKLVNEYRKHCDIEIDITHMNITECVKKLNIILK